jgi:hypothetical protein
MGLRILRHLVTRWHWLRWHQHISQSFLVGRVQVEPMITPVAGRQLAHQGYYSSLDKSVSKKVKLARCSGSV